MVCWPIVPPLSLSVMESVLAAPVKLIHENVRLAVVLPLIPVASGAADVSQLQLVTAAVPEELASRFILQFENVCSVTPCLRTKVSFWSMMIAAGKPGVKGPEDGVTVSTWMGR